MNENISTIEYMKIMLILFLIKNIGVPDILELNFLLTGIIIYFVNRYVIFKLDYNQIVKKNIALKHLTVTTLFNILILFLLKYQYQYYFIIVFSNIITFIVIKQKYIDLKKVTNKNIENYFKDKKEESYVKKIQK
jgi:hypothetical protein